MFGSKLRAWMEAVRPKKKQHRKDKQGKHACNDRSSNTHTVTWKSSCLLNSEKKEKRQDTIRYCLGQQNDTNDGEAHNISRYSANNLSSPESAYSTGYSTDGTSPGGVPTEYTMTPGGNKSRDNTLQSRLHPNLNPQLPCTSRTNFQPTQEIAKVVVEEKETMVTTSTVFFGSVPEPAGLVSPRQRNRIRTNPWLPGGTSNAVSSPLPLRQEVKSTPLVYRKIRNSPVQRRYLSPATHRRSLSSSSCSSLSAHLDHRFPRSLSDEDDCTLNEMMGKYDESYVYEKETDILSDSDPTDCESDIDTGQDGGDEEDNGDEELDFIDNGSYVEVESKTENNTGHCLYYIPADIHRRKSSRRRTIRRGKEASDRRRKSSSSKKQKQLSERHKPSSLHKTGSKSAGATPVSSRKTNPKSPHHQVHEDSLKKRSNSVCLQRDVTQFLIEKRDREANMKYKELIGQAEQIIRTMNINGLSPRRLPGPTNKRVELLRSTECAKPEPFLGKNDETLNSNIAPSTVSFKNTRFSPKKNHITNFIISNSPVLVRKEMQAHVMPNRRMFPEEPLHSPLAIRSQNHSREETPIPSDLLGSDLTSVLRKTSGFSYCSPMSSRKTNFTPKSILHKTEPVATSICKTKDAGFHEGSSSSEDDRYKRKFSKSCPQSEPVRRKVYLGRNTINVTRTHGKTVAFNIEEDLPTESSKKGSSDNLKHQVLLNTIQNLKRNLEDHSALLQHSYRSTPYKY